jgi:hypothetical protein
MGVTRNSTQSPAGYSAQNLSGNQLAARMAAAYNVAQRQNLSASIGDLGYLFKIHPAETAAGLVDANLRFGYLPGVVDRYGLNAVPGTTSMLAAANLAIKQAKLGGGPDVVFGATAPYLIDGILDLTTAVGATNYGVTIRGEANNVAFSTSVPHRPQIIFKHALTQGFDCTGNNGLTFRDLSVGSDTVTFPKACFFLARNTDGASQICRFENVRAIGAFSDSVLYNFGSEDDVHIGCFYRNTTAGVAPKVIRMTSTNMSAFTSTFTAIDAAASVSTIDHNFIGCQFQNDSVDANADLIYYDAVSDVRYYGCWAYMAGGRAVHYHDGSHSVSQSISFRDWVTESISNSAHFADFSNNAGITSGWRFDNVVSYSTGTFLNCEGALPTLDEFKIDQVLDVTNHGINIPGTLQNSIAYFFGPITIGTDTGNELHGNCPVWAITTSTNSKWYDWASGALTWAPNLAGLTTATAVTFSNLRVSFDGSKISFNGQLNVGTALVSAAGQQITGLPKPAINGCDVSVVNATTEVGYAGAFISGSGITLPVINVGAGVTLLVSGSYFRA